MPRWFRVVVSAAAAIVLVSLAAPRTMAALHAFAADPIMRRGLAGEALAAPAWRFVVESRTLALEWTADWADGWLDLAFARAKLAALPETGGREKRELWRASRAAILLGLAKAPARPFAWARLSALDLALDEPRLAALALWLSVVTGPVELELILPRSRLALSLWEVIDERRRPTISSQFRLALQHRPQRFAKLLASSGKVDIVRHELSDAPALLNQLDGLLAIRLSSHRG